MDAHAESLLDLFKTKTQYEVPLFQRQYVWTDTRWAPLWEDISRKFADYLSDRKKAPAHFLGAMVLDQKLSPAGKVDKRQVIDGQQRLTTFQLFLSAFRDFFRDQKCNDLAEECDEFCLNTGKMLNPDVDKFKVWPTQLDRTQFKDVVSTGSRAQLLKLYPLRKKTPRSRKFEPRPRMVEAYFYFYDNIAVFFLGQGNEPPLSAEVPLDRRGEECFQALQEALKVVAIDLEAGDDAQVIFETLNARGEPLLPADLLRNFIFLRAARQSENQEKLYGEYWAQFDIPFWREEVIQGRLPRPRSDLFLQHFLASRVMADIPIKNLFVEYKHWIETEKPFARVSEELACLKAQGDHFRQIIAPRKDEPLHGLAGFLEAFDQRTCYPLLLAMFEAGLDDSQWAEVSTILESYLLRRAVCGLTTQGYNRTFLALIKSLRKSGLTPDRLGFHLMLMDGPSVQWPTDAEFQQSWSTIHAYHVLSNPRIVHIMKRLNETFVTSKQEDVKIGGVLTVEHILPQNWVSGWTLPGDLKGMTLGEAFNAPENDQRAKLSRIRYGKLQTLGNLTILSGALNSSQSNEPWSTKRPKLMANSLLPINLALGREEKWDEQAIDDRAADLFKRALKIWPRHEIEV